MEIDRNGLEVLDRGQCLALLGSAHVGRIGLSSGALRSGGTVPRTEGGVGLPPHAALGATFHATLSGSNSPSA